MKVAVTVTIYWLCTSSTAAICHPISYRTKSSLDATTSRLTATPIKVSLARSLMGHTTLLCCWLGWAGWMCCNPISTSWMQCNGICCSFPYFNQSLRLKRIKVHMEIFKQLTWINKDFGFWQLEFDFSSSHSPLSSEIAPPSIPGGYLKMTAVIRTIDATAASPIGQQPWEMRLLLLLLLLPIMLELQIV